MYHTLRMHPQAAALMEAKELRSHRDSELPAHTGCSQHTCDTSSTGQQVNFMNEPVHHNQQKPADTEQLQTSSEESTTLPGAPPGITSCCFPQNPPGSARASSPVGHKWSLGQAHLVPPCTHPPVRHRQPRKGVGSGVPAF